MSAGAAGVTPRDIFEAMQSTRLQPVMVWRCHLLETKPITLVSLSTPSPRINIRRSGLEVRAGSMVHAVKGSIVNGRKQILRTVEYLPDQNPKAILFFHHGYGEHIGRYEKGEHSANDNGKERFCCTALRLRQMTIRTTCSAHQTG